MTAEDTITHPRSEADQHNAASANQSISNTASQEVEQGEGTPVPSTPTPVLEDIKVSAEDLQQMPITRKWRTVKNYLLGLAIPILLIAMLLYAIPYFIDWDKKKAEIISATENFSGRKLSIDGDIMFRAFPMPHLILNGVRLHNSEAASTDYLISVKSIVVEPSITSLMTGSIKAKRVVLNEPVIELENFIDGSPNWTAVENSGGVASAQKIEDYVGLSHMEIEKGVIFFRSGSREKPIERKIDIEQANISMDSSVGPFSFDGFLNAKSADIIFEFEGEIDELTSEKPSEFTFNMRSGESKIELDGSIQDWSSKPKVVGKLDMALEQSVKAIANSFGLSDEIFPHMVNNILSSNLTTIAGDLELSAENATIQNMIFNAIHTKGKGSLNAVFGKVNKLNMDLFFESADFNILFAGTGDLRAAANENKARLSDAPMNAVQKTGLLTTEDLEVVLKLGIQAIDYRKHQFGPLSADAELIGGKTMIRSLTVRNLPGSSEAEWSGRLTQGADASQKFTGNFKLQGKEMIPMLNWLDINAVNVEGDILKKYIVDSELSIDAEKIQLSRVRIGFDDSNILGQAAINMDGEVVGNSAFKITKLDLDKYFGMAAAKEEKPETQNLDSFQLAMQEINEGLARFDVLRNIDIYFKRLAVAVNADELVFNKQSYNNFSTVFRFASGYLESEELKFESNLMGRVNGNIKLDTKELKPFIDVSLNVEKFDTAFISKLSGDKLAIDAEDGATADAAASPNANATKDPAIKLAKPPVVWPTETFDFNQLAIIAGKLNINIREFIHGKFRMDGIEFVADITADEVKIKSFRASLFDSRLDVSGNIGIKRPSVNATFSIANANVYDLLYSFFDYSFITGRMSASGSFSSSGYNVSQLVGSLEGTLSLAARGLVVDGFDSELISKKLPTLKEIKDVRYWAELATSSGQSKIDYIAGNVSISQGIVSVDNLPLTHGLFPQALLTSRLNLPNWTMDTTSSFTVKLEDKAQVPVTMTASGNIYQPTVEWDKKGMEKYWEDKFFRVR